MTILLSCCIEDGQICIKVEELTANCNVTAGNHINHPSGDLMLDIAGLGFGIEGGLVPLIVKEPKLDGIGIPQDQLPMIHSLHLRLAQGRWSFQSNPTLTASASGSASVSNILNYSHSAAQEQETTVGEYGKATPMVWLRLVPSIRGITGKCSRTCIWT